MDNEPEEDPAEQSFDPAKQALEKADDFRMFAELAAVFEGVRKFDAQIIPSLDADLARDIQRAMGRLDKSRTADIPLIPEPSMVEAATVLNAPGERDVSTNDYHIHRRPGEVMMIRWLAGEEVDTFYERLQAHFDAALNGFRGEERQAKEWKQDEKTLAYLAALDAIDVRLADRFLRQPIREHKLFVISTQTADEINIAYLADFIMNVPAEEIVGPASAPPEAPTEQDLAWFFKLFMLRGVRDDVEQMCFFAYLQKTDDSFDFE